MNAPLARPQLEHAQLAAAGYAGALLQVTAAIADAVRADEVYTALVDQVARVVGADSAGLWLIDESGRVAELKRSLGYAEPAKSRMTRLLLDTPIPVLDAIRRCEPVWIRSQSELIVQYPHLSSWVTPGRSYRISCLPLFADGRCVGALALTIDEGFVGSAHERDFLLLVARYAGQSLERLRLLDAERKSRALADAAAARLSVLSEASQRFAETRELEPMLSAVCHELSVRLGSCVNIALLQSDGRLHVAAAEHPDAEATKQILALWKQHPVKPGEGFTGGLLVGGEPACVPLLPAGDLEQRSPAEFRDFLRRYPPYALMGAPLKVSGRIIGTVTASRVNPGETYLPDDVALLAELADRAALAIENSRLYGDTVAARFRAEQLYRFAETVVTADDVAPVLDAALTAVDNTLKSARSAVLLFDERGVMRFRAWRGLSDAYRQSVDGHSPWAAGEQAPRPVVVTDALRDASMASYRELFEREGIGALAFIPLVTRGKLLGKLMVYFDRPHDWTAADVALAQQVSNHLASVIARFTAVSKLEETLRANELFAGVLAHDLRNPLAAIETAAQITLRRADNEPLTRAMSRVLSSSERMRTMIAQLLDFTRVRTGGELALEPRQTCIFELCTRAVDELELAHPDWRVVKQTRGDTTGTWDPDRLLQVVSNLVANAGQHGAGGTIDVHVDGTSPEHVELTVHNEGLIPQTEVPSLFDPFRVRKPKRGSMGLGLGLYIVHTIVRQHRGEVAVRSTPEDGTTFTVRLPRT